MSGKDLLALLAMITPGILLIALLTITLIPPSVMQPFPGSEAQREKSAVPSGPGKFSRVRKPLVLPEEPTGAGPVPATQKRMRDPWKPAYLKSASTP